MSQPENLGSFLKEGKTLLSEYVETRLDLIRLQGVRTSAKAAGQLIWILVSLFLVFLVLLLASLVLGFWLSELTGSFIKGFGYTTLIVLVLVGIIALLKDQLFVNPAIKKAISHLHEKEEDED